MAALSPGVARCKTRHWPRVGTRHEPTSRCCECALAPHGHMGLQTNAPGVSGHNGQAQCKSRWEPGASAWPSPATKRQRADKRARVAPRPSGGARATEAGLGRPPRGRHASSAPPPKIRLPSVAHTEREREREPHIGELDAKPAVKASTVTPISLSDPGGDRVRLRWRSPSRHALTAAGASWLRSHKTKEHDCVVASGVDPRSPINLAPR